MKSYFTGVIIEADLESIKDVRATKEIKTNTETLRKSDRGCNLPFTNLKRKTMEINRDETSIANYNHLELTLLPVNSDAEGIISTENSESCSGINKGPDSMIKDCNGNYWHQIAFVLINLGEEEDERFQLFEP